MQFSYGSFVASVVCASAALHASKPQLAAPLISFKRPHFSVTYRDIISSCGSAALVLTWLFNRHAAWAWIPQDMLGICFMLMMMQTIVLPDLRVASVFLAALFCYDIFMVFITPLFMPHGDSVMVRVARGGGAHETMPLLLVVPQLMPMPPIPRQMMLGALVLVCDCLLTRCSAHVTCTDTCRLRRCGRARLARCADATI
jgi:Signal peptide peptidase